MIEALSPLRPHELLAEVQDRIGQLAGVQTRKDRLREAMLVITAGLDDTPRSIAHTAIELVDAGCAPAPTATRRSGLADPAGGTTARWSAPLY